MDPTIDPTMWWENSVLWSAVAACISAFFAGLTVYFTYRKTTRQMIDITKADILVLTSGVQGRESWKATSNLSQEFEGGNIGPRTDRLAKLLSVRSKRYLKDKWLWIIPAAVEELRNEGFKWV